MSSERAVVGFVIMVLSAIALMVLGRYKDV